MKEEDKICWTDNISNELLETPLITASTIPFHMITLSNPEGKEANIDFNGDSVVYSGDLEIDESAKIFFEAVLQQFFVCRCGKEEPEEFDECPECKQMTLRNKSSGVECIDPECGHWFCY